jgi:hypothetical protein
MLCPKCLCEIPDESNICPICGAELTAPEAELDAATEVGSEGVNEDSKRPLFAKIVGIVGLAASCVPVAFEVLSLLPVLSIIPLLFSWLMNPSMIAGWIGSIVGLIVGKKVQDTPEGKLGMKLSKYGLIVSIAYAVYRVLIWLIAVVLCAFIFVIYAVVLFLILRTNSAM